MGKPLTKSQVAATVAEKAGISKKQATDALKALTDLVYKKAKDAFVIPGVGKVVLANRPAREMIMRFGPKAGQKIKVPAKRVLRFRFAKAAKDSILGAK